MSIESSVYDKVVSTERFTGVDATNKEQYAANLVSVECHIQPIDDAYSEDADGSFGKDFLMFCDVADIDESDRVIDGTDEYRVVGVKSHAFLGENRHMEIRIRKFNP
jgi:hypothetical protein